MKNLKDITEQVVDKRAGLVEEWGPWLDGAAKTPWEKGNLAVILEEQYKHAAKNNASLNEDVRTSNIATFEKFIFPMIRTVWPNLASLDLVSVQAMDGPVSMIFYFDFTAGSTKGRVKKGDVLAGARRGMNENAANYPSETVDLETWSNAATAATGFFSYVPVRPGSVTVSFELSGSAGTVRTMSDNGTGVASQSGGQATSLAINYVTGAYTWTIAGGETATNIQVTYDYNSEGPNFSSNPVPQIDAQLTNSPVVSRREALRILWSADMAASLRSIYGLDAEQELTEALAQQIRFSIDNIVINDLWRIASAGNVVFDAAPASPSIPWFTHQMALVKTLQSGSNMVFQETRRGFANWIVAGVDAATIIESHPLFESSGNLNGPGVVFSGVLAGKWKVWKNPFLTSTTTGEFGSANFLLGFKGNSFYDAGYVYAPWIPFYTTPTVQLDDMMYRKAVMTHFGRKAVNGLFYATGLIDNA